MRPVEWRFEAPSQQDFKCELLWRASGEDLNALFCVAKRVDCSTVVKLLGESRSECRTRESGYNWLQFTSSQVPFGRIDKASDFSHEKNRAELSWRSIIMSREKINFLRPSALRTVERNGPAQRLHGRSKAEPTDDPAGRVTGHQLNNRHH